VDVTALAAASCQQIIETTTSWSAINWSNDVICLRTGDHTGKGTLYIDSIGSAGTPKVLRCVADSGEECADPWTVSIVNRATVSKIEMNGGDHWIVDRVTVDMAGGSWGVRLTGDEDNNHVISRSYLFGGG